MNGNGTLRSKAAQPSQPQDKRGIFVPKQYAPQTPSVSEKSLQLNVNSPDDAKSVIQNLQAIKNAYDAAGDLTSVEILIAESVTREVEHTLLGAIRWCRTYTKHVAPQPGNILFVLPAYKDLTLQAAPISPASSQPVNTAPTALVKPQRPVRAEPARP